MQTFVTATNWNVSYSDSSDTDYVELNVFYIDYEAENEWGGHGVPIHHPEYNGLRFPITTTSRDAIDAARDFANSVGLIKVYEPLAR